MVFEVLLRVNPNEVSDGEIDTKSQNHELVSQLSKGQASSKLTLKVSDKDEEVYSIYNYYERSSSNKTFLLDDDSMNSQYKVNFMQRSIGQYSS